MRSPAPLPPPESYYTDNYIDYGKQNPPHKIRFYTDLVERWVKKGESIFELGVGLGLFLEKATEKFTCQGCDINPYGIETTRKIFPGFLFFRGRMKLFPRIPLPKRWCAGIRWNTYPIWIKP